jgi:medium-chain acyl-[acyl-carrier-protein] hydrolase
MAIKRSRAFVRKTDRPSARVQLLCFTYAASTAQVFHGWNAYVPDWIEVTGIELPGHGRRVMERPMDSYDEAAVLIADILEPVLNRPYAMFGHCLGAALGYEATRILRGRGRPQPLHLFVTGAGGPHHGIPIADVEAMTDDQLIEHLSEEYKAPLTFLTDPEMRRLFLPMVRADARMTQNYRYVPGPPVDYDITAFAGETDPYVDAARLDAWRQHTTGRLDTRLWPGSHFFFHEAAPQLLNEFTQALGPKV